jgi:hypothetical protein
VLNAAALSTYTLVDGKGARLAGNPLACVFCLACSNRSGSCSSACSAPGALWFKEGTCCVAWSRAPSSWPGVSSSQLAVGMIGLSAVRVLQ